MERSQAKQLQKRLRREINRADRLAWWSDEQKANTSLPITQRFEAEQRGVLAIATRRELQGVLEHLEEAMSDG